MLVAARRIYTGFPGSVIDDGAVLVEQDTIAAVGALSEFGSRAPDVDLGSMVVMPGLIDTHVHLGFDASEQAIEHMQDATRDGLRKTMLQNAQTLLQSGVTTARDLGAPAFVDVEARGAIAGPNLLLATRPLTTPKGHCWFMGGECADEVDLRRTIAENHAAGADCIKIMVTGGILTEGSSPNALQFDVPQIRVVVEEAHKRDMGVAAHAHGTAGIRAAAEGGVDTIEHCTFLGDVGIDFDQSVVELLSSSSAYVCPTVNCRTLHLPTEVGVDALTRVRILETRGVRTIAGTDAGVPLVPHDAYAAGLVALASTGRSNDVVLAMATSRAAAALGLGSVAGTIATGFRADLIATAGDPVEDLGALRCVDWVMCAGRSIVESCR